MECTPEHRCKNINSCYFCENEHLQKKYGKHNCDENAVHYESDGPLGHGWECAVCGKFLQAG